MKLIKVKGIVIREIQYKENDKIITLLTDKLGKISCMARSAKKNNSPLLSSSQFLVYSEFLLYKGKNFYHVNSAELIDSFYNLRIDYDKLEKAFELTKVLNKVVYEEEENTGVLSLYLNTLYILDKKDKNSRLLKNIFTLKLLCLLGYLPNVYKCCKCHKKMLEETEDKNNDIDGLLYYDKTSSSAICGSCVKEFSEKDILNMKRYQTISETALYAILYTISCDIKKVFNFEITGKVLEEYDKYINDYYMGQIM